MSSLVKKLGFVALVTVALIALYLIVTSAGEQSSQDVYADDFELKMKSEEVLLQTQKINSLNINTSVFDDVRYNSLINYRVELGNIETGRDNPFAPIQ